MASSKDFVVPASCNPCEGQFDVRILHKEGKTYGVEAVGESGYWNGTVCEDVKIADLAADSCGCFYEVTEEEALQLLTEGLERNQRMQEALRVQHAAILRALEVMNGG